MMNEPEKSDPSTVAAKPANKIRRSEEESAEPREGAKGNTPEPHTHRTQSRASVSPGVALHSIADLSWSGTLLLLKRGQRRPHCA